VDSFEYRLLNDFQRDFPLEERPYRHIAAQLGVPEHRVLAALRKLAAEEKISRIGMTFTPGVIGAAALIALAVPSDNVDRIGRLVNAYPEVNHNYEREHRYNLWFVVTGPDEQHVRLTVRNIEAAANCGQALILPMITPYHIDLGFDLGRRLAPRARAAYAARAPLLPNASEKRLIFTLQQGLPLTSTPFADVAARSGMCEAEVRMTINRWVRAGAINRFGVVVRHHELGFSSNAMVVWDVPDDAVDAVGRRVAALPYVTLCYRRARQLPMWRYNLYCMIHGTDRDQVSSQVAQVRVMCGMISHPCQILFSRRRFKQAAAQYVRLVEGAMHG
jgi:DNA-binding Lrp family transcriptional regulator